VSVTLGYSCCSLSRMVFVDLSSVSRSNLRAKSSGEDIDPVYEDGVYPLYLPPPQLLQLSDNAVDEGGGLDIVFVHGIRGEQFRTWTSASGTWPLWLAEVMRDGNRLCVALEL
jgi:hypothetical protein